MMSTSDLAAPLSLLIIKCFFVCKCNSEIPFYCEDTCYESFSRDPMDIKSVDLPGIQSFWMKHPTNDFSHYTEKVKDYVGRRFTKEKDRRRAFDGLEMGRKCFHSLSVEHFAEALYFELDPQVCCTTPTSPSWSWQG